jgi:DNA-directed RNA polymerase specialized sigma24 family protein
VAERTLSRARAGDEEAFSELIDPYRAELQLHCYRILGTVQDAEDLLQETLLAAWRGLGLFDWFMPRRRARASSAAVGPSTFRPSRAPSPRRTHRPWIFQLSNTKE